MSALTLNKQPSLRLAQIESICRRQNKLNEKLKFGFGRNEDIAGRGENAGYKHFLLFQQCLEKKKKNENLVRKEENAFSPFPTTFSTLSSHLLSYN